MQHRARLLFSLVTCAIAQGLFAGSARAADDPPPPPSAIEIRLRGAGGSSTSKADANSEPPGEWLTPTAAVEVRFDEPMVGGDQIGAEAKESPLAITPKWEGSFRWTSERGGVFTPSEPPALGAAYRVSVKLGLVKADGQPLTKTAQAFFQAPALEVQNGNLRYGYRSALLQARLIFNGKVDAKAAEPFLWFRSEDGRRAKASAQAVSEKQRDELMSYFPYPRTRAGWADQFLAAHVPPGGSAPKEGYSNQLLVAPAEPLPVGKGWKLVAAEGLLASEDGARLAKPFELAVGDCKPFVVSEVNASNGGRDAHKIVISFTRPIDEKVTAENIERWLTVSPKPAEYQVTVNRSQDPRASGGVEVSGRFALNQTYAVAIARGLPAIGSVELETSFAKAVEFELKEPQLTFPEFSVHQLSDGRREFLMNALNAPDVQLRAKLIRPDDAPRALAEYHKEYLGADGNGDPQRVNFEKMPGRMIYNQRIAGSKDVDETESITLKWDDVLSGRRQGVVLIEAEQPLPNAGQEKRAGVQALVQLTNLGAVWKSSRAGELLAYVFSLNDAKPVAGAKVELIDAENRTLAEATTGADGVACLPNDSEQKAAFLALTKEQDCHVLRFGKSQRDVLSMYHFKLPDSAFRPRDGDDEEDAAAKPKTLPPDVLMFSDRGVYRPGETAHIKAIVREWNNNKLSNPKNGTRATLRAIDPRGRRFWRKDATLTAGGALDEAVPLPKSTLGRYRVEVTFGEPGAESDAASDAREDDEEEDGASASNVCRFQVQEYQPNAFEVKVGTPAIPPVGAGAVNLPLSARYYMGKTLSKAKVGWSLEAQDEAFAPAGFDDYQFCLSDDVDSRVRSGRGQMSLDGEGMLSDAGEMLISPEIQLNQGVPSPRRVSLRAGVTDQDQQTVAARASVLVHSSEFYLGVRKMPDVLRAGERLPLEVTAVNAADEQPHEQPVHVTATLSLIEWRTNEVENGRGGSDYNNKPHVTPVGSAELDTTAMRRFGSDWSAMNAGDTNAGNLIPAKGGEYLLEVSARDAAGREARTTTSFNVLGAEEAEWNFRSQWQAQLVPDRAQYAPGDTATILVKTPISGRALVTVEREGTARAYAVEIDKNRPAVQVPILPGDGPNVFVSVLLLRGLDQSTRKIKEPEYRAGYCQLAVTKADAKLAVDVQPDKTEYQPGEEVTVRVAVTDEMRRPARNAEVTLYAVDKGVLSLTGYKLPDPLRAFYRPRPLDVRTGLTLPDLMAEDPAYYNSGEYYGGSNKGYLVGGGGGEIRGDRMRKNFQACAYWNGALRTDERGYVEARFIAPDNLSQYSIMAVVHTGGASGEADAAGRFGSGQGEFRINKPLMLEPAMPRFGNVGDRLKLRAVLHNLSPTAGEAEVTLELDDKATAFGADGQPSAEARARRVRLAAGESKAVDFPVEFLRTGQAQWTWRARLTGDGANPAVWRDSVQTTLNVGHPTPRRAEIVSRRLDAERAEDILARVNPELLEGEDGIVSVSLSNTRINDITEGMRALLHYPYGCVEQTTSSLLPWVALRDFGDALPDLHRPNAEVESAVERGVNRLLSMQTESGGLAYWPDERKGEAHPWGSAYGGMGLALARKAGFFVPEAPFNKLCAYLSKQLRSDAKSTRDVYHEHSETDRCLALYALATAGKAEAAYCEQMYNRRDALCPEDRALLALAIAAGEGPKEMARTLLTPGSREGEKPDSWNEFASKPALTGMRLLAWCEAQPEDEQVIKLLDDLLGQRNADGAWSTTQGNAWTLLGMSAYARNAGSELAGIEGKVTLGGQSQPFTLDKDRRTFACELPFGAGKPVLTVTNPAKRALYLQAKVEARPRGGALLQTKPTVGNGEYVIRRQYDKVNDDGTKSPAAGLKVGDRVLVSLDISVPGGAAYVAVNDPLPAVLEAINPEFKTQDSLVAPSRSMYGWWVSDFRELREDRALFFCNHPYMGHMHLQYLARVRAAGSATAPAAKIEEMYHPDRYAQTAADSLSAAPFD